MTLTGGDGDYPPTDEAGFLDGARTLRIPDLYEAIMDAEPLGPIVGYRATENRLRHYDRVRRWPEGLVALGDVVCALNPVYGQGMTTAALGAEVLDRCLRRSRAAGHPAGHGSEVPARLARTIAAPVAAGHRHGLPLSAHRRTAAAAVHSDDAPLRRCVDPARDAQRGRATAADGGAPPAPPARGAFGPGVLGPMAWAWLTGGAAE